MIGWMNINKTQQFIYKTKSYRSSFELIFIKNFRNVDFVAQTHSLPPCSNIYLSLFSQIDPFLAVNERWREKVLKFKCGNKKSDQLSAPFTDYQPCFMWMD